MNRQSLSADELQAVSHVRYRDVEFTAEYGADGFIVYLPVSRFLIPACAMEDARDFTYLTHCLDAGSYPQPEALRGILNREEVERLYSC